MKTVEIYLKSNLTKIEYDDVDYVSIERGEALIFPDVDPDKMYLILGWERGRRESATYELNNIDHMFIY